MEIAVGCRKRHLDPKCVEVRCMPDTRYVPEFYDPCLILVRGADSLVQT